MLAQKDEVKRVEEEERKSPGEWLEAQMAERVELVDERTGKTYFCKKKEEREEEEEEGQEDEVVAKIQDQIVETFKFTQEPVQQHTVLASTCQCRSS